MGPISFVLDPAIVDIRGQDIDHYTLLDILKIPLKKIF
jgi:hypothetical protein